MFNYMPSDHYWRVGENVWSSKRGQWVETDDATLAEWIARGGVVTAVATAQDVRDALANAGLGPLGPDYVPHVVDMWQARAALRDAGKLTAANLAISSQGYEVRDAWEYGNTVRRDAPVIAAMGAALGLSDADIDNLFRLAATKRV
jgi:hypothetical protein